MKSAACPSSGPARPWRLPSQTRIPSARSFLSHYLLWPACLAPAGLRNDDSYFFGFVKRVHGRNETVVNRAFQRFHCAIDCGPHDWLLLIEEATQYVIG